MSNIKQHAVLEFVTEKIKSEIADIQLEKQSESISILKDGNDIIHIEHTAGDKDQSVSVSITDKKEILYSEDLLEILKDIHLEANSGTEIYNALKNTAITVNGLNIETKFIFQAVKEFFDELSNSYQFLKILSKEPNKINVEFQFGSTKFQLLVVNGVDQIAASGEFNNSIDPKIKATIDSDIVKVQQALNKMFKD